MKTAIVYYSKHHGNTKKLIDTIAKENDDITLIDAAQEPNADLAAFDLVGFASGIYYSKFHKSVLQTAKDRLPSGKRVFLLYTFGAKKDGYTKAIREAVAASGGVVAGEYGCFGFNTFGPFKLIGGMAKGHPTADEVEGAALFFKTLL